MGGHFINSQGRYEDSDKLATFYATVEILNTQTKQWSSVSSLPFSTTCPAVSICGEHIYVHAGHAPQTSSKEAPSAVRCSLFSLVFSTPESDIWEKIATLPVKGSKLVTVKGCLLAVRGESTKKCLLKKFISTTLVPTYGRLSVK